MSFSSHSPSQDYSATGRYHFVFLLSLSLAGLLCYWQISLCLSPLALPRRITLLLADITLSFSSHSPSQNYSATDRYHFVFLLSLSLTGLLCYWQISLCLSPLALPRRITLLLADITLSFSSHSPSQDYSATGRYHFVFLLSLSLTGLLCYWEISLCLSPLTLPHRITLLLGDITLSFSSHSPSQDYSATGGYHFVFLLSLSLTGLLCYWQISLCLSPLALPHRITLLLGDITLSFSSRTPSQDYSATGRYHFVLLFSLSLAGLLCYWQISLCLSPLTLPHRITLLLTDITLSFSSRSPSQDYSATGRYHFVFLLSLSLTGLLCYWQISLCLALLTLPCRITLLLADITLSFSSHSPSQDYSATGRYHFVLLFSLSLAGLLCYWQISLCLSPLTLPHRITLLLADITLSFSSHSLSQDYSATGRYHFVFLLSLSLTGLLCYWQISLCLSPLALPHRITLLLADITLSFSSHSPSQDYSATGRYHFVFLLSHSLDRAIL